MILPNIEFESPPGGVHPVQSWGAINGNKFFFFARYDSWNITIATDSKIDPLNMFLPHPQDIGLTPIKKVMFFENQPVAVYANEQGFYFEGEYKEHGPRGASFME